jgi:hypothetical protein
VVLTHTASHGVSFPAPETTPALQADVRRAVSRSLELWWRFFDGIATAVDAC